MPIVLPGLFDFSTGVSTAINQNTGRLQNEGLATQNYISQLNAFNQALNTNDNLEFRRGFAEQPTNTPVLDRFANFAANTTNPFALNQSLLAGASASPLLGQIGLRNPSFGLQQGLPQGINNLTQQGIFGIQAAQQQNFNSLLPQLLAQNNPQSNPQQLAQLFAQANAGANDSQLVQSTLQQLQESQRLQAELQRQNAALINQNRPASTSQARTTSTGNRSIIADRLGTTSQSNNGAGTVIPLANGSRN